jgi:cytochrome P450
VVWNESLTQAHQMMSWAEEHNALITNTVVDDVKTIAINVLGSAAYGSSKSWTPANAKSSTLPTSQPFFDALSIQTQFFILAGLVPAKVLSLPFWPQKIQDLAAAKINFSRYAQELIDTERASQAGKSGSRSNVMAMLINVLDQKDESPQEKIEGQKRTGMSADEVQGNLFILSIAGFETTANTLAYAFVLLAVYPEWQDWLVEEIDMVTSLQPQMVYGKTYPNLNRCLAFMVMLSHPSSCFGH